MTICVVVGSTWQREGDQLASCTEAHALSMKRERDQTDEAVHGSQSLGRDHPEMVRTGHVDRDQEADKVAVVAVTDAIVDPRTCEPVDLSFARLARDRERGRVRTMVIHPQHAALALSAMVCSRRLVLCDGLRDAHQCRAVRKGGKPARSSVANHRQRTLT